MGSRRRRVSARALGGGGGGLESSLPKGAYVPFGLGPRVCLGMRLSLLETRAVVAVLLQRLDWAPAPRSALLSRRRRVAGRLRRWLGREEKEEVGKLRLTYPGTAALPDGAKLLVKGRR